MTLIISKRFVNNKWETLIWIDSTQNIFFYFDSEPDETTADNARTAYLSARYLSQLEQGVLL